MTPVLFGIRSVGKETLPTTLASILLDRRSGDIYITEKATLKAKGSVVDLQVNSLLWHLRLTRKVTVEMQSKNDNRKLGHLLFDMLVYAKRAGYKYFVSVDDDVVFHIDWDGVETSFTADTSLVWLACEPTYGTFKLREGRKDLVKDDLLDPMLAVIDVQRLDLNTVAHLKNHGFGEFLVAGRFAPGRQVDFLIRYHNGYDPTGGSNEASAIKELREVFEEKYAE